MNREELKTLAKDFLKTYGYYAKQVSNQKRAIVFSRPTGMGVADELLVYFHEKGEESVLDYNLAKLSEDYQRIPGGENGRRFFLPNAPLGLTPPTVTSMGFTYQVPAFFFDREFSSNRTKTPLMNLEEEIEKHERERVPQPYRMNGEIQDDLLNRLQKDLASSSDPCIRVIIAPAGYGKTVLMSGVYKRLLEQFKDLKEKQRMGIRPLMMLPGHLKRADDLDSLINNFIGDEYDFGIAFPTTFKFWINKGLAVWLLDGLEELILKIPEGFIDRLLEDYIYAPGSSNPKIIISIRKPLLVSSPELREALDTWRGAGITIYELIDWGKEQRELYFRRNLVMPKLEVDKFLNQVTANETLKALCTVPYYCSLMAGLKSDDQWSTFSDDTHLVEYAFDKICQREFTKGVDSEIFPVEKQKELFSIIALESLKHRRISTEDFRGWAAAELPQHMSQEIMKQQLACLERHAVLGSASDFIEFIHDILRQFLLAHGLLHELRQNNIDYFEFEEIEPDSLTYRYLVKHSQSFDWNQLSEALWELPSSPQENARGFRNLLKICLAFPNDEKKLLIKPLLSKRNLSGVRFLRMDMQGYEFGSSRLDSSEFTECNLTGAHFDACHFKETLISDDCILNGATLAGAIFESIQTSKESIYDQKEIQRFFYARTQRPIEEIKGPCQAAINLKKVFEKFTRKGQGFKIPKNFILGIKCPGGVNASNFVESALSNDYLVEEGGRLKVKANRYVETVQYVNGFKVTDGLKKILDVTCRDTSVGCMHVFA